MLEVRFLSTLICRKKVTLKSGGFHDFFRFRYINAFLDKKWADGTMWTSRYSSPKYKDSNLSTLDASRGSLHYITDTYSSTSLQIRLMDFLNSYVGFDYFWKQVTWKMVNRKKERVPFIIDFWWVGSSIISQSFENEFAGSSHKLRLRMNAMCR